MEFWGKWKIGFFFWILGKHGTLNNEQIETLGNIDTNGKLKNGKIENFGHMENIDNWTMENSKLLGKIENGRKE